MKKLLNKTKLVEEDGPPLPPSSPNPPQNSSQQNPIATTTQVNSLVGKTLKFPSTTVIIESQIFEGSFGVVFLAKNSKLNFALKRIVVNNDNDKQVAVKEIDFLTQLTRLGTPYTLHLLDSQINILSPPDIYEILSLTNYCKTSLLNILTKAVTTKTPLKEQLILKILSDIFQGVAAIHSLKIIHRDLKIENILEQNGIFLICDFGSATDKILDPDINQPHLIIEELEKYTTLAYRSPEMVDLYSNRGPITLKSDIWAIGVLAYKLCYWVCPYGESILAIQNARKPDFPLTPPYSQNLQTLISYMLIPDQTNRPDIYQISELLHSTILEIQNPVLPKTTSPWTLNEIQDYLKNVSIESVEIVNKKVVLPTAVPVLETSVTPRQRPKAGGATNLVPTENKIDKIMPPPKSPKPDRKNANQETEPGTLKPIGSSSSLTTGESSIATTPPTVATGSVPHWNPFETDSFTVTSAQNNDSNEILDDPFAAAPFDYFKYQPMMQGANNELNPFLTSTNTTNNVVKPKGVTNYSFEDIP